MSTKYETTLILNQKVCEWLGAFRWLKHFKIWNFFSKVLWTKPKSNAFSVKCERVKIFYVVYGLQLSSENIGLQQYYKSKDKNHLQYLSCVIFMLYTWTHFIFLKHHHQLFRFWLLWSCLNFDWLKSPKVLLLLWCSWYKFIGLWPRAQN